MRRSADMLAMLALVAIASFSGAARAGAKVVVHCEPEVVVRGEEVRCSAKPKDPAAWFLVARVAVAQGRERREALREPHAPGEEVEWTGPAVVDTAVSFSLLINGEVSTAQAAFHVRARPIERRQLRDEGVLCHLDRGAKVLADPPQLEAGSTPAEPVPASRSLSRSQLSLPPPTWELVDHGPDRDWYFVRSLSGKPLSLDILLTRTLEPEAQFRLAQHGDRSLPTRSSALWPHCREADLELLHRQVWELEGCAGNNPDSRVHRVQRILGEQLDIDGELERMVMPFDPAAKVNPFARALSGRLRAFEDALLNSAAAQPPPVRLGCRLRYPLP